MRSRWARARLDGITLIICVPSCLTLPGHPHGLLTVVLRPGFGPADVMTVAELAPGRRRGGAPGPDDHRRTDRPSGDRLAGRHSRHHRLPARRATHRSSAAAR
ncbi:hypothetical protein ACQPXS_01455 [Streptomyces sp. CA-142005]|uniref:hypothetical protein n=1 Tax=Streptomyces sp. CA-142005 TaxID=3240052 RepID=UPI003D8F81DE